jgi:hypothetical protein
MASRDTDVRKYKSRYNQRDDAHVMYDAVAECTKRVRIGKYGVSARWRPVRG